MAEIVQPLADFPGFAVLYDPTANPFFRPIIVENLRKLKSVAVGKSLLSSIAAAEPRSRDIFPVGINVMCKPTKMNFTQSGFKREVLYGDGGKQTVTGMSPDARPQFSPQGCPFWMAGGSANEACDTKAATNTQGSVCYMHFSNVQVMTRKGEKADPYIVLAHELVHSLHCLQGITMDGKDEELWTTGIGKYSNNSMSENAFRSAFGCPPRNTYF